MNPARIVVIAFSSFWPLLALASATNCPSSANVEQLLKSKYRYDQKTVCVTGLLRIEFEGSQLSLHESKVWLQFFEWPEHTNESIDRDEKRMKEWERSYQDQCVVVRGRFSLKATGHFGMWPGGIDRIERITRASPGACSPKPARTR